MINKDAKGAADRFMAKLQSNGFTMNDFEFPKEMGEKCTEEEFHKMMTTFNSEIPIERVNFLDYPASD